MYIIVLMLFTFELRGKRMSTSKQRAEEADRLIAEEQNAMRLHRSEAIKSLHEFSDYATRLPDAVVSGELDNQYDFNPAFRSAWDGREENPAALEDALRQTARGLDQMAERIHATDDSEDTTGSFPDGLKSVTRDLRS